MVVKRFKVNTEDTRTTPKGIKMIIILMMSLFLILNGYFTCLSIGINYIKKLH